MFKQPGEKLKFWANILFWSTIVGSFVLALVFGIDRNGWGEEINALFFVFLLGGAITAYIQGLLLYAFGELVTSVTDATDMLMGEEEDEE